MLALGNQTGPLYQPRVGWEVEEGDPRGKGYMYILWLIHVELDIKATKFL